MFARASLVVLAAAVAGCERDPVEHICPDVTTGGLVITEVRGDQDPDDALGQWVEIYNASGVELDLVGLKIRIRELDGSSEDRILIRTSVTVAADGYVVIGLGAPADQPAFVNYAADADAAAVMPSVAAIDVDACDDPGTDQFADQMVYRNGLPSTGTYSLGVQPPTAESNENAANWCTSVTAMGTPGQANDPCP